MKLLPFFLLSLFLLVGCGKPNLDNPAKLNEILEEAIDGDKLQWRGKEGEKLGYAPNSQTPYTGWVKAMHENGQVSVLYPLKDGKQHGLMTQWHENGQKKIEANFVDGETHGLGSMWDENGQKRMECTFKDGKEHGLGTEWDEEGNVTEQAKFENGKVVEEIK